MTTMVQIQSDDFEKFVNSWFMHDGVNQAIIKDSTLENRSKAFLLLGYCCAQGWKIEDGDVGDQSLYFILEPTSN